MISRILDWLFYQLWWKGGVAPSLPPARQREVIGSCKACGKDILSGDAITMTTDGDYCGSCDVWDTPAG